MKTLTALLIVFFLCSCSLKIAKPKYDFKENEQVFFEGCIPHSKEPLLFPINININGNSLGNIEAGSNNLTLYYVTSSNEKIKLWQYTDYSCVKKITVDLQQNILKVYYNRTLVRDESFVNILSLDKYKLKEVLLKRGSLRL